jgi:hypothetical protein
MNNKEYGMIINNIELIKDKPNLSNEALKILYTKNAGGSSSYSEALSFEILSFLHNMTLYKTEMELVYRPGSKITDFSIKIKHNNKNIGVSVTRGMKYKKRDDIVFTNDNAMALLNKKLYGILVSNKNIISQKWDKQILHILVQEEYMIPILWDVYHSNIRDELKSNTCVIITLLNLPNVYK